MSYSFSDFREEVPTAYKSYYMGIEVEIELSRDRRGSFEPQFIQKHQSFDPDLEHRITGMYARGTTAKESHDLTFQSKIACLMPEKRIVWFLTYVDPSTLFVPS